MGSSRQTRHGLTMQNAKLVVDTIRFVVLPDRLPSWLRNEFSGLLADAPQAPGETAAHRRTSISVGNISLRQNALGEVIVENSLHRFLHGHNGGTFTRSDIAAATHKLSVTLGFDIADCELRRVDIGLNLSIVPQMALAALTDYKGRGFTKWERGTAITGAKRLLTELGISFYDKGRELAQKRLAALSTPTLRFELTSRASRFTRRLGAYTVAELATSAFTAKAGAELLDRLGACHFRDLLDFTLLTGEEIEALALVSNLEIWAAYKADRTNKDKATRRRKLAEQAQKRASIGSIKSDLIRLAKQAILELA